MMVHGMPLLIVCSLRLLWQAKEMWSLVRKSALAKLDMLKLPCGSAPFTSAWIGWRNSIPHIDEDGVCWDLLCVLKDNDALRSGGNTCVSPAASCVPRIPHSPRPPPLPPPPPPTHKRCTHLSMQQRAGTKMEPREANPTGKTSR